MVIAAILNPAAAVIYLVCAFLFGTLLTGARNGVLCSNVAGYLGSATADANDAVGEWQQYVLRKNSKGMNTGSTLFGLMSRLANEDADAQVYNWWEKDPVRRNFYSTADRAQADTTISFDDNGTVPVTDIWVFLAAGSILLNDRTGERIRVTATPTTSTVTIARGVQGTTAPAGSTSITNNDAWTLVTLAKANGAVPRRSAYAQPSSVQNYIQTFNATASVENAYKAGILRTDIDGPKMEQTLDALEQVANDIEYAYFLGVKEVANLTEGATYYTGGIKNAIDAAGLTTNALNGNGASGVTLDAFSAWISSFMRKGSDTKLGFFGPAAYEAISKYANTAAGGYRTQDHTETVFGLNIETIKTPTGQLSMAMHPLFGNNPIYNDWGFVIDLQLIVQKIMEPLFFQEYEPVNGQDAWQGQFRAKLGLKQKFPEAFGYCYDLQKITA